ncbi:MAG: sensor histidine kinase [Eubacterium sp.]
MIKKVWKKAKYIIIPLICIAACCFFSTVFDYFSNGIILDWLDTNFTYEQFNENADGTNTYIHNINWSAVKSYLLNFAIVSTITVSFIIMLISKGYKKKNTIAASHNISNYMNRYILDNEPLPVEIPQEYAEVFTKISEIKLKIQQNEKQLLDESERKNDLVTYLAHDLKTPLTSVIGYLALLNDENSLSKEQQNKYISVALNKAERLEDLTSELFEITRFNVTDIELQTEDVNLSKMTEQIAYEFKPLLKNKRLNIKLDIEQNIHIIYDIDKLERVIDNLIRNAVNYSYADSDIMIALYQSESDIILKFENRGKTIPKEKLSRIFEQFYRIDSARNTATGGSGLGLAIAKKLVEAGGGQITAQSDNETIVFTLTLPKKS